MKKLFLFTGVCLALLVLVAGCAESNGAAVEIDAGMGAAAAASLTEARINGVVGAMEVMAVTDEVLTTEWDSMSHILTQFEQSTIPLVAWFALPDGSYYTVDAGKASANLTDRAYFPKVMAGQTVIGDLVVSKSTGRKAMVAVVPVIDGADVVGALGVSVYLEELSEIIAADMALPTDMVLYAVNGEDVIALHSDTGMLLEDASALDGGPERSASATCAMLGWTFTLGYAD